MAYQGHFQASNRNGDTCDPSIGQSSTQIACVHLLKRKNICHDSAVTPEVLMEPDCPLCLPRNLDRLELVTSMLNHISFCLQALDKFEKLFECEATCDGNAYFNHISFCLQALDNIEDV